MASLMSYASILRGGPRAVTREGASEFDPQLPQRWFSPRRRSRRCHYWAASPRRRALARMATWKRITLEKEQAILDSVRKADAERAAKLLPPASPIPGQFVMPSRPFGLSIPPISPITIPLFVRGKCACGRAGECLDCVEYVDGSERWIVVRHCESEW